MNKRIRRIPHRCPTRNSDGSILVLTLVLVGVLAISVAAMLGSVRHLVRSADDKIAEEECYQTAMAGLNTTKAWLMRADLATSQTGATIAGNLAGITSGALELSNYVVNNKKTPGVIEGLTTADIAEYFDPASLVGTVPDYNGGSTGEGSRRAVIYEWGGGTAADPKPIVIRRGESNFGTPSGPVYNVALGTDARSWVERIRITTPYRGEGAPPPDNLRMTSLIIEVEAKAAGAGYEKTRVLSGRVLVIPQRNLLPPAQAGAAIISGAVLAIAGNSPLKIHWGPVWSKNHLTVLGLSYSRGSIHPDQVQLGNPPKLTFTTGGNDRWTGVGADDGLGNIDKWVRFQTGTQGKLVAKDGITAIFAAGGGRQNPIEVTDFFHQLSTNQFSNWTTGTYEQIVDNSIGVKLEGLNPDYASGPGAVGMLYDLDATGSFADFGSGALAQGLESVDKGINDSFASLDYLTWKNFAIANKGYVRPSNSGYINATGQPLYVTSQRTLTTFNNGNRFQSLVQISMENLLPADGNTAGLPDRILFIDTAEGTEGGTKKTAKITSSDKMFWKGMIFINGHMDIGGAGAMRTVWGKNPDQYVASPPDKDNLGEGELITQCLIDGILRVTGTVTQTGNPRVYGSVVGGINDPNDPGGFGSGGAPEVFYNPRCKDGLFRDPLDPLQWGIVSGPVVELAAYTE